MHLSTIFVKLTISKNTSVKTNFYRLGSQTLQNTKKKKKKRNQSSKHSFSLPLPPLLPPRLKPSPLLCARRECISHFEGNQFQTRDFKVETTKRLQLRGARSIRGARNFDVPIRSRRSIFHRKKEREKGGRAAAYFRRWGRKRGGEGINSARGENRRALLSRAR